MDERTYIKGFNHGYLYKRSRNELYDHVLNGLEKDSDYALGFSDGGKQHEIERTQQQIKERMDKARGNDRSQ